MTAFHGPVRDLSARQCGQQGHPGQWRFRRTCRRLQALALRSQYAARYAAVSGERFPIQAAPLSDINPEYLCKVVSYPTHEQPGTIVIDLFAIPGHFSGYRPGYSKRGRDKDCFTWAILKAHTNNTAGRVRLNSTDPCDPPDINFHYFDEGTDVRGDDLDGVVSAIEFVRKITARTASLFDEEIPGETAKTRSELAQFVKGSAWGHHACGTCKIGADGDSFAVLDGRFQVRGTQGLRVVDASVFPKIPGFFILSAIYMIAEKASDVILDDARRRGWVPTTVSVTDRSAS